MALVRFVDGELARAVQPLPADKGAIALLALASPLTRTSCGWPQDPSGAALNPGRSRRLISSLEFKDREIVVDINGGGRGKQRLRDRIHLEVGGAADDDDYPTRHSRKYELRGATLFLDFDKQVPDMTPEELKQYLSGLLDFSKQHSAAVQWMDSLPPDIQKAIQDKRPAAGMDRGEMVVAALGRPDRKVREKTPDGDETEDWIYGKPPAKTIFVKFDSAVLGGFLLGNYGRKETGGG